MKKRLFFCVLIGILVCCHPMFAYDWQAQWIASDVTEAVPYFARDFAAKKHVKKATLRASALGVMTLRLNGKPVSENRLEPTVDEKI